MKPLMAAFDDFILSAQPDPRCRTLVLEGISEKQYARPIGNALLLVHY